MLYIQAVIFIVERAIRERYAPEPVANWLLTGYNTLDVSFHSVFYFCAQLRAQHWRTKLRESCLGAIEITVKEGALILTGGVIAAKQGHLRSSQKC